MSENFAHEIRKRERLNELSRSFRVLLDVGSHAMTVEAAEGLAAAYEDRSGTAEQIEARISELPFDAREAHRLLKEQLDKEKQSRTMAEETIKGTEIERKKQEYRTKRDERRKMKVAKFKAERKPRIRKGRRGKDPPLLEDDFDFPKYGAVHGTTRLASRPKHNPMVQAQPPAKDASSGHGDDDMDVDLD